MIINGLYNHRKTSSSGDLILSGPILNRSFSQIPSKRPDDRAADNKPNSFGQNYRSV